MTIGERVEALRKAQGLTQRELADALGLNSQASISLIESGINQPSINVALKMATLFGVTLDTLLNNGDEAVSQPEAEVCAPA